MGAKLRRKMWDMACCGCQITQKNLGYGLLWVPNYAEKCGIWLAVGAKLRRKIGIRLVSDDKIKIINGE